MVQNLPRACDRSTGLRHVARAAALALAALALVGCTAARSDEVILAVVNAGPEPLRCLLVFGHWVTIDVPVVAPGAESSVTVRRAADRSLYVPRADGRRMMVEHILCDRDRSWGRALVHMSLDAVRRGDRARYEVRCDGIRCGPWRPARS